MLHLVYTVIFWLLLNNSSMPFSKYNSRKTIMFKTTDLFNMQYIFSFLFAFTSLILLLEFLADLLTYLFFFYCFKVCILVVSLFRTCRIYVIGSTFIMINFDEGNLIRLPIVSRLQNCHTLLLVKNLHLKYFFSSGDFVPLIGLILEGRKKKRMTMKLKMFSLY